MAALPSSSINSGASSSASAASASASASAASASASASASSPIVSDRNQLAVMLIQNLHHDDRRKRALAILAQKRGLFPHLALLLWYSSGAIAVLLQEVLSVYPLLSSPALTLAQSGRVCNALALLQCVASHPDTRIVFTRACVPLYLYPFLNTTSETKPFEFLRLTSLGVIGALVKVRDTEVILSLLSTEFMPICLRAMERGSELSKTVAIFILERILVDDYGIEYVCFLPERFFAVNQALGNVVAALVRQPSLRQLKLVIRCYLRLSADGRCLRAFRYCLPKLLIDGTFYSSVWIDQTARMWLGQLQENLRRAAGA